QPFREYLYVESFGRTTLECAAGRQPPRLSAWGPRKYLLPGRTLRGLLLFRVCLLRAVEFKEHESKIESGFQFHQRVYAANKGLSMTIFWNGYRDLVVCLEKAGHLLLTKRRSNAPKRPKKVPVAVTMTITIEIERGVGRDGSDILLKPIADDSAQPRVESDRPAIAPATIPVGKS